MGERVMEGGHWNPAIVGGSTSGAEVWPLPVECLMNGMLPGPSDAHLALFGNSLILPPQFRHRFSQSAVHFPPSSMPLVGGHHLHGGGPSTLSIPPQHSMVESSDPSSLGRPPSDPQVITGQEPLRLHNDHHALDECSDECSDEEEDDEDGSEEDIDESGFVHHPHDQVSISAMGHPSLTVEEDSLPSCQHTQQQSNVINGDSLQQAAIMGAMEESCHQKNGMLTNGISHGPCHDDEIPTINHGHPLNSNPISAIPMITGNSLMMSDSAEDEFSENPPTSSEHHDTMDGDPSRGQSVHGKMYVEGRVIFNLKQWTDSGFGNFNSCREQEQQKNQLQGCAVCRLRSPNGQDYRGQQKVQHRHPVRGFLLSFEDCITVELYPEHQMSGISNVGPQPLDSKQHDMEIAKPDHPMPIISYLGSAVDTQSDPQMSNMVNTSLQLQKPPGAQQSTQEQSWWDDFDSERPEAEGDSSPNAPGEMQQQHHPPSCIMNMKLQSEPLQNSYHPQQPEISEKQINGNDVMEDGGMNGYHHLKCDRCSLGFLTNDQFESHQCITGLTVSEAQSVISLEPDFPKEEEEVIEEEGRQLIVPPVEINEKKDLEVNLEQVDQLDPSGDALTIEDCPSNSQEELKSQQKPANKISSKYPCPSCNKPFVFKKLLKQHLEEQHDSGNPFRCSQCNIQYADAKRLKRHSCTLSVEEIKNRQKKSQKNQRVEIIMDLQSDELDDDDDEDEMDQLDSSSRLHISEEGFSTGKEEENSNEPHEITRSRKSSEGETSKSEGKVKKKKIIKNVKFKRLKMEEETASNSKLRSVQRKLTRAVQEKEADDGEEELDDDEEDYETQTRFLSTNSNEVKSQIETRSSTSSSSGSNKKGFRCNICGKSFTVERRLINHKASHKTDRSSQCDKCGKRFARKDKLMRHMYVHSEEKMFVCEICEKRFSRRDKLSDHLKSHQTDEIHNCPMCEKQFLRPDILKQHVKLHRMGNKHQCPECLRFVTGKDRLAKHMKRHEESKALGQTLLCPLCTKYFIQRQSLKAHIKKFHPDALHQLELDGKSCDLNPESPTSSNMSSGDNREESEQPISSTSNKRSNVTTVCLLLEDVMGMSKVTSTKSKPFSCQQCSQTFARKQALKKHMQIKHSSSSGSSSGTSNNNSRSTKNTSKTKSEEVDNGAGDDPPEEMEESLLSMHGQCKDESNPSSLSSLSTSPSPPTTLMSMANILQHQQQDQQQHNISLSENELPSCSSLQQQGNDLIESQSSVVMSGHHHQQHQGQSSVHSLPQQAHLSAYSHHLALASMASMAVVNNNNNNNNSAVSLASSMQQHSLESGVHGQQQLSSLHSVGLSMGHHSHMNMNGGSSGSVMCSSSSYVLNYPPYHYQ